MTDTPKARSSFIARRIDGVLVNVSRIDEIMVDGRWIETSRWKRSPEEPDAVPIESES